jgi:hypothetical protein
MSHACSALFAPSDVTCPVNETRRYKANSAMPPTIHSAAANGRRSQRCLGPTDRWAWGGGHPVRRTSGGSASAAVCLLQAMVRTYSEILAGEDPYGAAGGENCSQLGLRSGSACLSAGELGYQAVRE